MNVPNGHSTGGDALALLVPPAVIEAIALAVVELLEKQGAATPAKSESPFLDVGEAAAYIRASRQRIYDLIHAGVLKPVRDGRRVLLTRDALDAMLERSAAFPLKVRSPGGNQGFAKTAGAGDGHDER